MHTFSIAEAKARLSYLVELAENGHAVTITKRGRPVVQLVPNSQPPQEFPSLAEFRNSLPKQGVSAAEAIRKLRDVGR